MIAYRECQSFEYLSDVGYIKTRAFKTFEHFKEYLQNVLKKHNYTLWIYKVCLEPNNSYQLYNKIYFKSFDKEAIVNEIEKYMAAAADKYPLLFDGQIHFYLANRYDAKVAELKYRNQIIDNIFALNHTSVHKNNLTEKQNKLAEYLFSMIYKADTDDIFSKSVFETYSNEQKDEFKQLKSELKNQYLQNKIIEKEDVTVDRLKHYCDLQYLY